MIKGGTGGSNTQTGAAFEGKTDLVTFLRSLKGYDCKLSSESKEKSPCYDIYFKDEFVASSFKQYALYNYLKARGVEWNKILSKRLVPDDAIYVIQDNTVFIIEIKYQQTPGSVDEKLQTCDFKLKHYKKLFYPLNYEVEYIYLLSKWFQQTKYKDTLDYIVYSNCKYYFDYVPLKKIGLPVPK